MTARSLVAVYLAAVTVTLWLSGHFPPWVSVADSFVGVGLVMVARNRLHERWRSDRRMAALILTGGLCALLMNLGRPQIAVASSAAFLAANAAATCAYELVGRRREAAGNVAFAGVDSLVFPWLAFGELVWWVVAGQFVAKLAGAWLWERALPR